MIISLICSESFPKFQRPCLISTCILNIDLLKIGYKKAAVLLTPAFLHEKNTVTTVPLKCILYKTTGFELLNKGTS